ncbi:MAG: LPS O-antigen subunit length determinant protein (WzzB/FepE family) [Roseivirga sp.]|jgi:LPS O-antigen subunit length determinant protein (WzzB/FepE family)
MGDMKKFGDEIDLIKLTKFVWLGRRLVLKFCLAFAIIGLVLALLIKRDYSAISVFVPQSNQAKGLNKGLGGLASLAGVNLGNGSADSELSPNLYPRIINSIEFKKKILETPLSTGTEDTALTYESYFWDVYQPGVLNNLQKYTLGLPSLISRSLGRSPDLLGSFASEYLTVSPKEVELFDRINKQLEVSLNETEGTVTISFAMPTPIHSAEMTDFVTKTLQKEVIEFRIEKANTILEYTQELYLDKKGEFESIQLRLSEYKDQNLNPSGEKARNELQKLQTEFDLSFNVYLEIAKQLEEARIRVKEDTPVFSIIQAIAVPNSPNPPRRLMLPIIGLVIGFFISVLYFIIKIIIMSLSDKWKSI